MRLPRLLLLIAFIVGGCAAQPPIAPPAPEPRPEPPTQVIPVQPVDTAVTPPPVFEPPVPPEQWWLLDAELDSVPGISLDRAFAGPLAGRMPQSTVIVGVIDSGVDVEHEDLRANIWVNAGEIPGTGRDDDGNGYVDDVHGWNFIGGADGRHVDEDTYELTRLEARCRANGARAPPDWPYDCAVIAEAFRARVTETLELIEQVRRMEMAVGLFYGLLRAHLGVDSLSMERVAAIRSLRPELMEARRIYLQLTSDEITPEIITEERERLEKLLEYGLNPEFDPRAIVGDDYVDPTQRHYGNADVRGPGGSHGTHVAGIIGAVRGNGIGIDGIAPAVRIMAIRAVPDGDERDKDVANAIRYAVDNGAQIINMSFGKGYSPEQHLVDAAVRYADSLGVLMVHAAGNDAADLNREPNYPTKHYLDGDSALLWIEVGASDWQRPDRLAAPFSNFGRARVDLFAPGTSIRSTVPSDDYQTHSGTSMAAPVVTGVAALLMAYYPELSATEVRRVILESATSYADREVVRPGTEDELVRFGELSRTGAIVNVLAAVLMAEELVTARKEALVGVARY